MMSTSRQILNKIKSLAVVSFGGGLAFGGLNIYNGNEEFYEDFLMPLAHKLDPEKSHNLAVFALKHKLIPKSKFQDPPILMCNIFGMKLSNPVGVAAGLDKQGEAVKGLTNIGFGFVEVGSVTPEPQNGQNKPRLFRLPQSEAIINRMGFNSDGHAIVHSRLKNLRESKNGDKLCIGVNLGKNKDSKDAIEDYSLGVKLFSDVADYLVINISSPNTSGLRDLQESTQLRKLLSEIIKVRNETVEKRPLLVKISPDLHDEQKKEIAKVLMEPSCKVDGIIISNTTITRPDNLEMNENGGLSGKPLLNMSTQLISDMYKLTKGTIPIIGVGGVASGQDAYHKILAGASLVQLYTSLTYKGPPMITRLKKELAEHLEINGHKNIQTAIGKASQ